MRSAYSEYGSDTTARLLDDLDGVAWTVGIEADKRRRGSAINVQVMDEDPERELAVVQVRECVFHPTRYSRVRKEYFLIGRNERTGEAFAHPVAGVTAPSATIDRVLCRVWQCTPRQLAGIRRQGDVAFIPERALPESATPVADADAIVLRDTHRLVLEDGAVYTTPDDTLYVVGRARLVHTKHQHAPVKSTKRGVWRLQQGYRARRWSFSAPTAD